MMYCMIPQQLMRKYPRPHRLTDRSFSALVYGQRCIVSCCSAYVVTERYIKTFSYLISQGFFAVQYLNKINSTYPLFFVVVSQNSPSLAQSVIGNDQVMKVVLGLLEALCTLQQHKFPHGAVDPANVFLTEQLEVKFGPPRPFLDDYLLILDQQADFSVLEDFRSAGKLIEYLISQKCAFYDSVVMRAAYMLQQGVLPGLVLEHMSQKGIYALENYLYEQIAGRQDVAEVVTAIKPKAERRHAQLLRVQPDDPFLAKLERLRIEADKISCKYVKLAKDTCNDHIIRACKHYNTHFHAKVRQECESISFSADSSAEASYQPQSAPEPTVHIAKVSVFTKELTEIDFAAQWGRLSGKTGKTRISQTNGATVDLSASGITIKMKAMPSMLETEGSAESDVLTIVMCCTGSKSKHFYSFTTEYAGTDRWLLSSCKTASIFIRIE